jgi:PAS domain S-box-containing protein
MSIQKKKEKEKKQKPQDKVFCRIPQTGEKLGTQLSLTKITKAVTKDKTLTAAEKSLILRTARLTSQELAKEFTRTLGAVEKRYQSLLEHASDGIIVADQEGKITFFNKRAEEMLGFQAQEIRGKDVFSIIPQKYHDEEKRARNNFLRTGASRAAGKTYEATALRKNGIEIPVEISFSISNIAGTYYFVGI